MEVVSSLHHEPWSLHLALPSMVISGFLSPMDQDTAPSHHFATGTCSWEYGDIPGGTWLCFPP